MATKKKQTKRKGKTIRQKKVKSRVSTAHIPSSYEDMLIAIASSGNDPKVSEESFAIHSMLTVCSESNISAASKLGLFVGKSIYAKMEHRSRGINDYLDHLSLFFESSGFNASYHIFPRQIEFDIWSERETKTGFRSHPFEAGIISGFLSSVLGNHVEVSEEDCRYCGSWACRFISNVSEKKMFREPYGIELRELASNLSMMDKPGEHKSISLAYDSMILSLLSKEGFGEAYRFMGSFGAMCREATGTDAVHIKRWISLMGLGSVSVRNKFIYVQLDKLVSRIEVGKLIGAFLNGFLDKHPIRIEISLNKGSYRLRFDR